MPGSSPTMARREPTSRLNSVDLPTLGRPTMAMRGEEVIEWKPKSKLHGSRGDSRPRLSSRVLLDKSYVELAFIIETPCLPVLSPPFPSPKAVHRSISFLGRADCCRRRILPTNFGAGSCKW